MTSGLGGLAPFFRRFLPLLNGYTPFFLPYFGHFWPPVNGFLPSPSGWACSDFTRNDMPIKFEVQDFKEGYFMAIVDKELYTQFTIHSYNKNGSTKSDFLTVAPLISAVHLFDIHLGRNKIDMTYSLTNDLFKNTNYTIYSSSFNNVSPLKKGILENRKSTIDISDLNSGNYILIIQTDKGQQSLKFSKL